MDGRRRGKGTSCLSREEEQDEGSPPSAQLLSGCSPLVAFPSVPRRLRRKMGAVAEEEELVEGEAETNLAEAEDLPEKKPSLPL